MPYIDLFDIIIIKMIDDNIDNSNALQHTLTLCQKTDYLPQYKSRRFT